MRKHANGYARWFITCAVAALAAVVGTIAVNDARAQEEAEQDITVEVRGIRLVGPAYGHEWRGLRAFNWSPGTGIAMLVLRPAGGIIDLDEEASELTAMTDDKGTNLLEGGQFGTMGFSFTTVADDSKALMTNLKGPRVPAAGATKITARGKLNLLTATEDKTATTNAVAPAKGNELKTEDGEFEWEVTKAAPAENGEGFAFTITTHRSLDAVKETKFLDADGNELEVQGRGTWTMRAPQMRVDSNYWVEKKPAKLSVQVTYWVDMEPVEVPFEITTGLGLEE